MRAIQRPLIAAILWVDVAAMAVEPTNLVSNGGFEHWEGNASLPAGWELLAGQSASAIHRDTETKHSGQAALRIDFTPAVNVCWPGCEVTGIHPDTEYALSGWARAMTQFDSPFIVNVEPNLGGTELKLGTNWTRWECSINSQDATAMEIGFRLRGSGSVWLDEVSLLQVGKIGKSVLPERREMLKLLAYQSHPIAPSSNTDAWTEPFRSRRGVAKMYGRPAQWRVGQWVRYLCHDELIVPSKKPEKRPLVALVDCAIVGKEKRNGKDYFWYQSVVRLDKYWVARATGRYETEEKILLGTRRKAVLSLLVDGPEFRDVLRYQLKVDDEPLLEYTDGERAVLPRLNIEHAWIRPSYSTNASVRRVFINTPLQWGDLHAHDATNRFSGFESVAETAEAVESAFPSQNTPLKWGVNESARFEHRQTRPTRGLVANSRCGYSNTKIANIPVTGLLGFEQHLPHLDRAARVVNWGNRWAKDERRGEKPRIIRLPQPPLITVAFDGFGELRHYREMLDAGVGAFHHLTVPYLGDARRFFNTMPAYFSAPSRWDVDIFDPCRSNFLGFAPHLDEPYQRQRKRAEYVKPGEAASPAEAGMRYSAAIEKLIADESFWPGQSTPDYNCPASIAWYSARAGASGFILENARLRDQMAEVAAVIGREPERAFVDELNIACMRGASRRFGTWWGQGLYRWTPEQFWKDELIYHARRGASYHGIWIDGGAAMKDPELKFYSRVVKLMPEMAAALRQVKPQPRQAAALILVPNGYVIGFAGAEPAKPWGILEFPRGQQITETVYKRAYELFTQGIPFDIAIDDPQNPPLSQYQQVIRVQ